METGTIIALVILSYFIIMGLYKSTPYAMKREEEQQRRYKEKRKTEKEDQEKKLARESNEFLRKEKISRNRSNLKYTGAISLRYFLTQMLDRKDKSSFDKSTEDILVYLQAIYGYNPKIDGQLFCTLHDVPDNWKYSEINSSTFRSMLGRFSDKRIIADFNLSEEARIPNDDYPKRGHFEPITDYWDRIGFNCDEFEIETPALPTGEQWYQEMLKHPEWQEKRQEILERDNHTCKHCGSTSNLQVHHKAYTGLPWEAPDYDLITLCYNCHREEHKTTKAA